MRNVGLKLTVKKFDISKFYGAFGEGSMEKFEKLEEEAQMGRCGLSRHLFILLSQAQHIEQPQQVLPGQ